MVVPTIIWFVPLISDEAALDSFALNIAIGLFGWY
jgi:hypothetical protein